MNQKIVAQRNIYTVTGDTTHLTIVGRDGLMTDYTIDTDCLDMVRRHVWRIEKDQPLSTIGDIKSVPIQRLLRGLGMDDKRYVKHQNEDRHDLRLSNLRVGAKPLKPDLTRLNQTTFTDVYFHPNRKRKWRQFQAFAPGKDRRHIGYFPTEEDAATARDQWIRKNHWKPTKCGRSPGLRKGQQMQ